MSPLIACITSSLIPFFLGPITHLLSHFFVVFANILVVTRVTPSRVYCECIYTRFSVFSARRSTIQRATSGHPFSTHNLSRYVHHCFPALPLVTLVPASWHSTCSVSLLRIYVIPNTTVLSISRHSSLKRPISFLVQGVVRYNRHLQHVYPLNMTCRRISCRAHTHSRRKA